MKKNIFRLVAAFPGILMLLLGIFFLAQPEQTATGKGMKLLDDIGRSTQTGTFSQKWHQYELCLL